MGESWQDAYFVSVHGRSMKGLAQRIDGRTKVALLTDAENSPNRIAEYLLSFGMTEYRAFVAENLQGENEKTGWYELRGNGRYRVFSIKCRYFEKGSRWTELALGIEDEEFSQRKPDKGLITKKEIRVLSLYALQLKEK